MAIETVTKVGFDPARFVKVTSDIVSGYGFFGNEKLTNQDLLTIYGDSNGYASFLENTGFNVRRSSLIADFFKSREEIGRTVVAVGTEAVKMAMDLKGISSASRLVASTSIDPYGDGSWAYQIAKNCNIPVENVDLSYLACNGCVEGLMRLLKRDDVSFDDDFVVLSVEPVGYLTYKSDKYVKPLFDNGFAVFIGRKGVIRRVKSVFGVIPDYNGVIRSTTSYRLQDFGGTSSDILLENDRGIFIKIPELEESGGTGVNMIREKATRLFIDMARRAGVYALREYYTQYYGLNGQDLPIDYVVAHQPNRGLHELAGRKILSDIRPVLDNLKVSEGISMHPPSIPWPLTGNHANYASGMVLTSLTELAAQGKLAVPSPQGTMLGMVGYGEGGTYTGGVVWLGPS